MGVVKTAPFSFRFEVRQLSIIYICDGKVEKCKNSIGCAFNRNRMYDMCRHTKDEAHARYGRCEGSPEWYPKRFYCYKEDMYVEKERL